LFSYSCEPFERWFNEEEANKVPEAVTEYLRRSSTKNNENTCIVDKNLLCLNKKKSAGILVAIFGCGIHINFTEMVRSESLTLVKELIEKTNKAVEKSLEFCIYDNGCHLSESIKKTHASNEYVKDIICAIDRFHIKNHKRQVCRTEFCCDKYPKLSNLNSQVCEQSFSHLAKYKHMVKHMNKNHFKFFFWWLLNKLNSIKIKKMKT
jgi:hypothetical protein